MNTVDEQKGFKVLLYNLEQL